MAKAFQRRPLPFRRPSPKVRSGLLDEAAPQLGLHLLHGRRIVCAERIQDGAAIGLCLLWCHWGHRGPPSFSASALNSLILRCLRTVSVSAGTAGGGGAAGGRRTERPPRAPR